MGTRRHAGAGRSRDYRPVPANGGEQSAGSDASLAQLNSTIFGGIPEESGQGRGIRDTVSASELEAARDSAWPGQVWLPDGATYEEAAEQVVRERAREVLVADDAAIDAIWSTMRGELRRALVAFRGAEMWWVLGARAHSMAKQVSSGRGARR